MSLLSRAEGEMKSGKTLWAVRIAWRAHWQGLPVWTNMHSVKFAEHIELDDLLMFRKDIYRGVVLLDEAHTFLDPRQTRSAISGFMTYWLTQAGKRKLPVYYTSHLSGMVMPAARNLTGTIVQCLTPRKGGAVFLDSYNYQRFMRLKMWHNEKWPETKPRTIHARAVWETFKVYDPTEVIDPFAFYRSRFNTTNAAKKILAAQDGVETAIRGANGLMRGQPSAASLQDKRMDAMEQRMAKILDQNERFMAGQMAYDPAPHGPVTTFGIPEEE